VSPIAFEAVLARCERARDRLARGAALRPAARVLRDMAPFPDRRRGDPSVGRTQRPTVLQTPTTPSWLTR